MENQIMLFQPAKYPAELLKGLKAACENVPEINEAFFACMQFADPNAHPKILIALSATGDLNQIIPQLSKHIGKIDFDMSTIEFTNANIEPFQNYFAKIPPFYVK